MQIHNFYSDPVPSVRNPLDSIVLSPHTINPAEFSLVAIERDYNDYQSLLPSICSCQYHDQENCSPSKLLWDSVQDVFYRLFKCRKSIEDKN